MIYDHDGDNDDCWMEINAPIITFPNGQTGLVFNLGITVTTAGMVPNLLGLSLASTEYELRIGSTSGAIVGTGSSLLNTSVIIPGVQMAANTQYFVRVRYNSTLYSSMWSEFVTFTTGAI